MIGDDVETRIFAKRSALQAIYQWQISRTNLAEIERQFLDELQTAKILHNRYKSGLLCNETERNLLEELLEKYCHIKEIKEQVLEELQTAKTLYKRYKDGLELSEAERTLLENLLKKHCYISETEAQEPLCWDVLIEHLYIDILNKHCCDPNIDAKYFKELLHTIPQRLDEIDAALCEFVDRSIVSIDPVERAVLRIGAYELLFRPELPYRDVLNESINLAKLFGAAQGHKYVNGILDKVAHKSRAVEIAAVPGRRPPR